MRPEKVRYTNLHQTPGRQAFKWEMSVIIRSYCKNFRMRAFTKNDENLVLEKFDDVIERRLSPGFGKLHVLANRFVITRRLAAGSRTIFASVL
jgi:hypothetical protein